MPASLNPPVDLPVPVRPVFSRPLLYAPEILISPGSGGPRRKCPEVLLDQDSIPITYISPQGDSIPEIILLIILRTLQNRSVISHRLETTPERLYLKRAFSWALSPEGDLWASLCSASTEDTFLSAEYNILWHPKARHDLKQFHFLLRMRGFEYTSVPTAVFRECP